MGQLVIQNDTVDLSLNGRTTESLNMSYYQTDPFNRNFNCGSSESDIPYVFKFSRTWEIPHGHLSGVGDKLLF